MSSRVSETTIYQNYIDYIVRHIKEYLEAEKTKNETVSGTVKKVEIRHPRAYVELHEIVDNRYWVGYLKRGQDIVKFLEDMLKGLE